MGRVIYIGTKYFPSQEKLDDLHRLQATINDTRTGIMVECGFDKWAYNLRFDMLSSLLRDKWKIIEGGIKDEPANISSQKETSCKTL